MSLACLGSLPSQAQTTPPATKKPAAPPEPFDPRPLARYVQKEGLVFYAEHSGLDAHHDAWTKTAAYKILNETSLGHVLELMITQGADRILKSLPNRKLNGADVLTIAKHIARHGALVASIQPKTEGKVQEHDVYVFKAASTKEARPSFSRLIGTLMGENRPQMLKKGTRTVVLVPGGDKSKNSWVWWSEQNDLVVCPEADFEIVAAVLDGQSPNAIDHPVRAEVFKSENGFIPVMAMFFDASEIRPSNAEFGPSAAKLKAALDSSRVDFRSGFHDDALMSITRVKAKRPFKSPYLAAFDQPKLDKTKLPPIPEGLESFRRGQP